MNDGSVFLVVERKSVAVSCGARPGNTLATFSNPSTVFGAHLSRCIFAGIPLMPSPVSVIAKRRNRPRDTQDASRETRATRTIAEWLHLEMYKDLQLAFVIRVIF